MIEIITMRSSARRLGQVRKKILQSFESAERGVLFTAGGISGQLDMVGPFFVRYDKSGWGNIMKYPLEMMEIQAVP